MEEVEEETQKPGGALSADPGGLTLTQKPANVHSADPGGLT